MTDADVGEDLAYQVFFAAHRRRLRLLVIAGLIVVTLSSGVAVALTHRSGAGSAARHAVASRHAISAAAARREIYAIARAQYRAVSTGADGTRRVTFGPLVLREDRARLPVSVMSGPLGGVGQELFFARDTEGHWHMTDVRQTWIS